MCLGPQGIDDNDGGFVGRRRARGLSNDNRGLGGERGIDNVSEGLKTTKDSDEGSTTDPRNLQQQRSRRQRNMSMNT